MASYSASKERIEVYSKGRIWITDDFKRTIAYNVPGFKIVKTRQDKGHYNQFQLLVDQIQKGLEPIIPINEIINVSKASIFAIRSMKEKKWISIDN